MSRCVSLTISERNPDSFGKGVSEKRLFDHGQSGSDGPPVKGSAGIPSHQDCWEVDAPPAKCRGYLDTIHPRHDMVEKQTGFSGKRDVGQKLIAGGKGVDAEALDFKREFERGAQGRVVDDRKHNSIC